MALEHINIPANTQPTDGLIVFLHGWGANMNDLASLVTAFNLPQYQWLFPDAPIDHPQAPGGKMWYDLSNQNYAGLTESRQLLQNWLISLPEKTGVPLSRTILGGFSQGGAMTMDIGLTLPFAGLVVMSGYLHTPPQPSDQIPNMIIFHGSLDPIVPVDMARQAQHVLTNMGASVEYHEFEMGHEINLEEVNLIKDFIVNTLDH